MKKAAVGATAAGIVWSAPRVEGLSLRPNYAAAGSAAGPSTASANLIFDFNGTQNRFDASAAGALGGGNIRVLGHYDATGADSPPTRLTISEFIYNGTGTAVITGMSTGGNVSSPNPSAGPATPLPTGNASHFDAPIPVTDAANAANRHTWRTTFSCS